LIRAVKPVERKCNILLPYIILHTILCFQVTNILMFITQNVIFHKQEKLTMTLGSIPHRLEYDSILRCDIPVVYKLQGGSNMTGTDLYVNKPHCAAAVRP